MNKKTIFSFFVLVLLLLIPYHAFALSMDEVKADIKAELKDGTTTNYTIKDPEEENAVAYSFKPERTAVYIFSASDYELALLDMYQVLPSGKLEFMCCETDELELALEAGQSYILYVYWACNNPDEGDMETSLAVASRGPVVAGSGFCGEDMTWEMDELGKLVITGTGAMYKDAEWEWESTGIEITSLVISEGVTEISDEAFRFCDKMTSVSFPSTLETIGKDAFCNCRALTSIVIPDRVTCIRTSAFERCRALTSVTMSESVKEIGSKAFYGTGIDSITLPACIEYVGAKAFGYIYKDGSVKKNTVFVVNGYKGSAAQNCAENTKLVFHSIGSVTIEEPELLSISENDGSTRLAFNSVAYATKYILYRKAEEGSWEKMETISREDIFVKHDPDRDEEYVEARYIPAGTEITIYPYCIEELYGVTCSYSVQAVNGTVRSSYNQTGLAWKYVDRPFFTLSNGSTSIDVNAEFYHGGERYVIYRKVAGGTWESVKSGALSVDPLSREDLTFKDKNVASGKKYYYKIKVYYTAADGTSCSKTSYLSNITRIDKASFSVSNSSSGVLIKWDKVKDAKGYYVYRDYNIIKQFSGNATLTYVDKGVINGSEHEYTVVAYASDGSKGYKYSSKMIMRLGKPSLSSASNVTSGSVLLKWKANSSARGYQIQYSTNKSMKSNVETVTIHSYKTVSKKISRLSKGKTYYFRIRSYGVKDYDEKKSYSAWSGKKAVKIVK